jgi:hypothetical protein
VPEASDPWKIDALFDGVRMKLAFPQSLNNLTELPAAIQETVERVVMALPSLRANGSASTSLN